jgi:iron(III) transport system permease protein
MSSVPVAALRLPHGLRPRFLVAAAVGVATLLAIPLVSIVASVLVPGGQAWDHLVATVLPGYVRNSLWLLAWVALGTCATGVAAAWLVTSCQFPGRSVLEWALVLPLAMPAYVIAYAYTDLLQYSGPVQTALREAFAWSRGDYWFPDVRSLGGAAAMFVCVLYPYVYLLARVAFLEQSSSLAEAGRTLGLSPWKSFFRVNLPLARPAVAAGVALALMETLADFGTVAYFGVPTFTTGIYRAWLSMGEPVSAAKLSLCLLAFVMLVLALERASRRGARFFETPSPKQRLRVVLAGPHALAATLVCALPLLAGFLLPLALLVRMSVAGGDEQFGARFVALAANSFTLAATTAAIAVSLALLMAYGARLAKSRLASAINRFAALGYTVPGSVIAVGVLIPAARVDHFIADLTGSGLILTGSIAALVYAYLVRFLAVALQTVEAGLAKITPSMEDAARSLGLGAAETLARVHAPLLKPSLVTAGLLVFVDVMKELPATFVMRPFNFDTLAVQAFNLAADERLAEASTASLAIVAVGLLPVILASRRIVRPQAAGK